MTKEQFQSLLRKSREGVSSPEEEKIINDWYNSIGTDEDVNLSSLEEEILENKYWYNVEAHIQKTKSPEKIARKHVALYSWRKVSVAATLLLGMISFAYWISISKSSPSVFSSSKSVDSRKKEITNNGSQPQEILLLDGSHITLQPGSRASFLEPFNSTQREVYLEGEAFFEVAKDQQHPFLVYTNEVITKVLGTSFFVRAKKNEKEIVVTVKTGRVMVYTQHLKREKGSGKMLEEVILKPNQQVVYNRRNESVSKKLIEKPQIILAQPTFKMNYSNAPVSDILEALEESYGVDIQFDKDALSACTLTTDLTEEGLYERIEIICNALGATYVSVDTAIVIEAKSCK